MTYLVISYVEGLQSGILNPLLFAENPASRTFIIAIPNIGVFFLPALPKFSQSRFQAGSSKIPFHVNVSLNPALYFDQIADLVNYPSRPRYAVMHF